MKVRSKLTRRCMIKAIGTGVGCEAFSFAAASAHKKKRTSTKLGLVAYCCRFRREHHKAKFDLYSPKRFLDHCKSVNAGGIQVSLGKLTRQDALALRRRCEELELYLEAIIRVPKSKTDLSRFEEEMRAAVDAGAKAVRTTIIPGRRYEYFNSLRHFREFEAAGRRALETAAPIAEKLRLPLAVENHKDHRNDERVALFKAISSEFVGACVDTGNSIALLEDPIETATALAPWAHSVHLKDQSLRAYRDGFLLADVPLGQGSLDLKRIVTILRKQKPSINFSLELITRDPLKVPVFSDDYWRTFPNLPAKRLAATLKYVRDHSRDNLQYISRMTPPERLAREDANVATSLAYARQHLGL